MPRSSWDTAVVPPAEAFDYFREGVCSSFMPLKPVLEREKRAGFRGRLTSYGLGRSALNLIEAPAYRILRGTREIAASEEDCLYLNYQVAGTCLIEQSGVVVRLRPGSVAVFDSSECFRLDISERHSHHVASLLVPKKLAGALARTAGAPRLLSDHPVYGELLVSAYETLIRAVPGRREGEVRRVEEILLSLADAAADDTPRPAPDVPRRTALFWQLQDIVRRNLTDGAFQPADCARMAGISTGYLHQVFAAHGSRFGRYLVEQRLRLAGSWLRDAGRSHLPVSTIAYSAGFNDLSHFQRSFRAHFGCTPGEYRRGGL